LTLQKFSLVRKKLSYFLRVYGITLMSSTITNAKEPVSTGQDVPDSNVSEVPQVPKDIMDVMDIMDIMDPSGKDLPQSFQPLQSFQPIVPSLTSGKPTVQIEANLQPDQSVRLGEPVQSFHSQPIQPIGQVRSHSFQSFGQGQQVQHVQLPKSSQQEPVQQFVKGSALQQSVNVLPVQQMMQMQHHVQVEPLLAQEQFRQPIRQEEDEKGSGKNEAEEKKESPAEIRSRMLGGLVGCVVGDAVGSPHKKRPRHTYVVHDDMERNLHYNLVPGCFTDDASMMLCLSSSLTEKGFDPLDQMYRYSIWRISGYMSCDVLKGCLDIGATTKAAIGDYLRDINSSGEANELYYGVKDSNANGCITRLMPIPVFFYSNTREACIHARLASQVTHASQDCLDAAMFLSYILVQLINGVEKDLVLEPDDLFVENITSTRVQDLAMGGYKKKSRRDIRTSSDVVDTLEAALWAFYNSASFEFGMHVLAGMGDDVDGCCAVFGQLAGTYYGYSGIPKRWLDSLQQVGTIAQICMGLIETVLPVPSPNAILRMQKEQNRILLAEQWQLQRSMQEQKEAAYMENIQRQMKKKKEKKKKKNGNAQLQQQIENDRVKEELRAQMEKEMRKEIEEQMRREIGEKMRREMEMNMMQSGSLVIPKGNSGGSGGNFQGKKKKKKNGREEQGQEKNEALQQR
jgi:ADP-ribosyl-[dinitrogen reductase] hydrolase